MIDDKFKAFGIWLQGMVVKHQGELLSVCAGDQYKISTVKRKFGQLESFQYALSIFSELYNGDLNKFNEGYLDLKENDDDQGRTDS